MDVISERLLGWRWQRASIGDRRAFILALRNYLIARFAFRVHGMDAGRTIVVVRTSVEGQTTLVTTAIGDGTGPDIPFTWRVVIGNAGPRLCDITVRNVSMSSIMQAQFDAVLQGSADITPLLGVLRERSDEDTVAQ